MIYSQASQSLPPIYAVIKIFSASESVPLHLEAKTNMFNNIIENLELMDPHQPSIFHIEVSLNSQNHIFTAKCTTLQVQRTGSV